VARRPYSEVRTCRSSAHGHTDSLWYPKTSPFPILQNLMLIPPIIISSGCYTARNPPDASEFPALTGGAAEKDPRKIWRLFASNYYLGGAESSARSCRRLFSKPWLGGDMEPNPASVDRPWTGLRGRSPARRIAGIQRELGGQGSMEGDRLSLKQHRSTRAMAP